MPLFDYFCEACNKVYEVLKFNSEPEPYCEIHKEKAMIKNKVISGTFIRKGAGIYSMDIDQKKPGDWPE